MNLPKKCVVDTNVPKTANLATHASTDDDVPLECVKDCVLAVQHVTTKKCLVIDAGDEIFDEYRGQLSMSGQPGIGDAFMKWVHDHRYTLPGEQRVKITRNNDTYYEFPQRDDLADFDKADMKFVAVANAHKDKPPILQAVDHKWWGWKEALADVGISVHFLCPDFTELKFNKFK